MNPPSADTINALAAISDRLSLFMILTASFVIPAFSLVIIWLSRISARTRRDELGLKKTGITAEAKQDLGMQELMKVTLGLVGDAVASIRANTDTLVVMRDAMKADIGQVSSATADRIVPILSDKVSTLAQRNYEVGVSISKNLDALTTETRINFEKLPGAVREAVAPPILAGLTTIEEAILGFKRDRDDDRIRDQQSYTTMVRSLESGMQQINEAIARIASQFAAPPAPQVPDAKKEQTAV